MKWRWDQGHLSYFQFDTIRQIARTLSSLENVPLRQPDADPLRSPLTLATGYPFAAPRGYRVWRNYGRVFGCCLLAVDVDHRLICTEICHSLAGHGNAEMSAEAYFSLFTRRFYYPSPVFEGYSHRRTQVFPVCAILKLLLSKIRAGIRAAVTVEEIFALLVANGCTGEESVRHYAGLDPRAYSPTGDERRQVRELLIFISQMSFLKWLYPALHLDIEPANETALAAVEQLARPERRERSAEASRELLSLGATGHIPATPLGFPAASDLDLTFVEGRPRRAFHLRYERSPKLREMFFRNNRAPYICDMCSMNVTLQYPWCPQLLELHHLLPLASPVRVDQRRTSLSDLVPICPSCHKATHVRYKLWLEEHNQEDFVSYEEARLVYDIAKSSIVLST